LSASVGSAAQERDRIYKTSWVIAGPQKVTSLYDERSIEKFGNWYAGAEVSRSASGRHYETGDFVILDTRIRADITILGYTKFNLVGFDFESSLTAKGIDYYHMRVILNNRVFVEFENFLKEPRTFPLGTFGAWSGFVGPIPVRVRSEASLGVRHTPMTNSGGLVHFSADARVYGSVMVGLGVGNTFLGAGVGPDGWAVPMDAHLSQDVKCDFAARRLDISTPLEVSSYSGVDLTAEWHVLRPTNVRWVRGYWGIPYLAADWVWKRQTARRNLIRSPRETKNMDLYKAGWSF